MPARAGCCPESTEDMKSKTPGEGSRWVNLRPPLHRVAVRYRWPDIESRRFANGHISVTGPICSGKVASRLPSLGCVPGESKMASIKAGGDCGGCTSRAVFNSKCAVGLLVGPKLSHIDNSQLNIMLLREICDDPPAPSPSPPQHLFATAATLAEPLNRRGGWRRSAQAGARGARHIIAMGRGMTRD